MMAAVPRINALLILDSHGKRLTAKYYGTWMPKGPDSDKHRHAFESSLWKKTRGTSARSEAEIITSSGQLCCFRSGTDVKVYVVGSGEESELVLAHVLEGFFDALNGVLQGGTDRRTILDHLEMVMLLVDEVCDGGIVLETDAASLMSRVLMREVDDPAAMSGGGGQTNGQGVPIGDMTIGQALKQAREQLISNLGQRDGF